MERTAAVRAFYRGRLCEQLRGGGRDRTLRPRVRHPARVGLRVDGDLGAPRPPFRRAEAHYGIPLVAVRKAHAFATRGVIFKESERQLPYAGLDAPSRKGLRPGEPTNANEWRSRFNCPEGCGKPSVATRLCWSNLPYHPHTPHGRLQLYAERRALLCRRNQIEGTFSALQVGYKQCLDGAARVRLFDRTVNEGLIAISLVTRALLVLLAERKLRGEIK